MRILIIGKNGQVARSLAVAAEQAGLAYLALSREQIDLSVPDEAATALCGHIGSFAPDVVINAAAYTAVDKAEEEEALATRINADGPGACAKVAYDAGMPFIHLSTDYVFDGNKDAPYDETDLVNPTGAYGRSKLAGERLVMANHPDAVIFRTAWVFSPYGHNFLKTMLRLAESRDALSVVADQHGTPTYAPDMAVALLDAAEQLVEARGGGVTFKGVTHLVAGGFTTWHGFADEIFIEASAHGGPRPLVHPITSEEFPTPAKRPPNSRLSTERLEAVWDIKLPTWENAVKRCLSLLRDNQA